jgi:hypothetical protein
MKRIQKYDNSAHRRIEYPNIYRYYLYQICHILVKENPFFMNGFGILHTLQGNLHEVAILLEKALE